MNYFIDFTDQRSMKEYLTLIQYIQWSQMN